MENPKKQRFFVDLEEGGEIPLPLTNTCLKHIVDSMLDHSPLTGKFEAPQLLVEKVGHFLTELIIEGQLKPGQSLSEVDLNRRYGISRSPIREALRILEQKGLVASIPRKGAYVRQLTKKDVQEIFQVRAVLEGFAATQAVEKLTPTDMEDLASAVGSMRISANDNDFKSFLRHHYRFHRIYIVASGNDYLITLLDKILDQAVWLHQAYEYLLRSFQHSIEKHSQILDAFRKQSVHEAERIVAQHILAAAEPMSEHLPEVVDYGK